MRWCQSHRIEAGFGSPDITVGTVTLMPGFPELMLLLLMSMRVGFQATGAPHRVAMYGLKGTGDVNPGT
jgi:hypothetical protein